MLYVWIAVIVVSTLLAAFLFLPASVLTDFSESGFKAEFSLLGGLIKVSHRRGTRKKGKDKNPDASDRECDDSEKEDEGFLQSINKAVRYIRIVRRVYSKSRYRISRKISLSADVKITFGMNDAALTGISAGLVWALLYEALGLASTLARVKSHSFNVEPVFDKSLFKLDARCIFRFKPVNIISIGIFVLIYYKKVKAEMDYGNTD